MNINMKEYNKLLPGLIGCTLTTLRGRSSMSLNLFERVPKTSMSLENPDVGSVHPNDDYLASRINRGKL